MADEWVEVLAKRLGPPIFTTRDEVRFNCWKQECGSTKTPDTKYHMYVNPIAGKYFCQRCQKGGSLEWLAKALGIEAPGESLLHWERVIQSFVFGDKEPVKEVPEIQWPEEYNALFVGTKAYRYVQERGITEQMIDFYQIGFGTGFLKNRIIFPDTDKDGKLVYWVARTYAEDGKPRAKYRNADAPREKQVYNLGRLERDNMKDRVVICEGPISAIIAGYNAVATYGKYVTGEQIDRLARFKAAEYVIAGDGDGLYEATSLATRLYRRGLNVRFARFFGDEDPASVGPAVVQQRIESALTWNSTSVLEVLV